MCDRLDLLTSSTTHSGPLFYALQGKYGYLVKWKGYGEDQNSWVAQEDAS